MATKTYIKYVEVQADVEILTWDYFITNVHRGSCISYFEEGKDFNRIEDFLASKLGKSTQVKIIQRPTDDKLVPIEVFKSENEPTQLIVESLDSGVELEVTE